MTSDKRQTAFVITANDSVEAVCLGSEAETEALRDRLKAEYVAEQRRARGAHWESVIYWAVREAPLFT